MRALDIQPGDRFGHWTVLETGLHTGPRNVRASLCQCDCGTQRIVTNAYLNSGHTKSCGCARNEAAIAVSKAHGYSGTRLYNIWQRMNERCYNPKHPHHKYYENIEVCDEWRENFLAFREWALSHGYQDDLSIDRIDGTGDYRPENCRWATNEEQANNLKWNVNLTLGGKTQSMSRWARELNIPVSTLYSRLLAGWDEVKALTYPIDKRRSTKKKKEDRTA